MRVLLISTFFPPQHAVASLRAASFAAAFVRAGCDVTVLTTEKRPDQRGLNMTVEGCKIVEVPYRAGPVRRWLRRLEPLPQTDNRTNATAPPSGDHSLIEPVRRAARSIKEHTGIFSAVRMPDLTDAWIAPATQWALAQPPWDLVLSSSGPYTTHLVARQLREHGHAKKWIADLRDLWTGNHTYRGLFPFTMIEKRRERQCLQSADLIVTVSDGLAEILRSKTSRRVEVVYNGYDEALPSEFAAGVAHALSADTFNIVYTGTVYPPAQDPGPMLEALSIISRTQPQSAARLRLVVAGERAEVWARLRDQHKLGEMVDLRGVVSHDEARQMQRDADCLLLLDWNGPQRGVLTAKVFEYLAAKAPILAVGRDHNSSLGEFLQRAGRGVHAGDHGPTIADLLRRLTADRSALGLAPDHSFIQSLSRQQQADRLVALAEELVTKPVSG